MYEKLVEATSMNNIMDYLDWRGDIGFDQDGLNEVDNLIFSMVAYLNFDMRSL